MLVNEIATMTAVKVKEISTSTFTKVARGMKRLSRLNFIERSPRKVGICLAVWLLVNIAGTEYTSAVGSLAAGAYEIVTVTDTVSRLAGPVTITATVDSAGVIAESNETNNGMTVDLTVYNNGYKGKRWTDGCDLTTQATFDGQYDVVYSAGNTAYTGANWVESTYSWTAADLPIPAGATVVDARLYQGYTYNKMGVDPAFTALVEG